MKKNFIYIGVIFLIAVIIASATFAYLFAATNSSKNAMFTNSSKLGIVYTGDADIIGLLNLVSSKEEGVNATVKIKLSSDSVDAKTNVYIKVNEIGPDIASDALNWELYRTYMGVESFVANGTFEGVSNGDKIYVDRDYILSTNETAYTVYIWLDGNKIGNEALGEKIVGYIGAEAVHITDLR